MAVYRIEFGDIESIRVSDITMSVHGYKTDIVITDSFGSCVRLVFKAVDEAELQKLKPEREYARNLEQTLRSLMPFVLEEHYPNCATPNYNKAVEAAKNLVSRNEPQDPLGR